MNDEAMRLKEELDHARRKCEELNRELCCQLEQNKIMSAKLAEAEQTIEENKEDLAFLRGQVTSFEFVFRQGRK